jgi:hypothetical protein
MMRTKTVDIKGRLFLGKEYIGKTFIFTQVSDTRIVLDLAVVVPAEEYASLRSAERPTRAEEVSVDQVKASPHDPDEDEKEEDHVPTAQVADTEVQSGPNEKVPPPQRKKTSGNPNVDLPPAPTMTPEQQRIMAAAVKMFFWYIRKYKPVTPEVIFPAFQMARGEVLNHYLREYGFDLRTPNLSTNKILKELRKEGLWVEKKPLAQEIMMFFKDMKVRLESEGVDMSVQREISDETKELIERVREVLSEVGSLPEAMNRLNELGVRTTRGLKWTDSNFTSFCRKYIPKEEIPPSKEPEGTEEND